MIRKATLIAFVIVCTITITNKLAPIVFGGDVNPDETVTGLAIVVGIAIWFICQIALRRAGELSAARISSYERRKALRFSRCDYALLDLQYMALHREMIERRNEIC